MGTEPARKLYESGVPPRNRLQFGGHHAVPVVEFVPPSARGPRHHSRS